MAFDTGNFIVIGGSGGLNQRVYIHERLNNNGKPGKIVTFADGVGDVKEIAKGYIEQGFDPNKIIINGQPASDVFESEKTLLAKDELKTQGQKPEQKDFWTKLLTAIGLSSLLSSRAGNSFLNLHMIDQLNQQNQLMTQNQLFIQQQMLDNQLHQQAVQDHLRMTTPGMGFI